MWERLTNFVSSAFTFVSRSLFCQSQKPRMRPDAIFHLFPVVFFVSGRVGISQMYLWEALLLSSFSARI